MMFGFFAASYLSVLRMYWRYNLSDWCSMMMGAITFVLTYSVGIFAWKRGASGLFVTVDFLLAAIGLWLFHNKLLKITSQSIEEEEALISQNDRIQIGKGLSSHHIKNISVKDVISGYSQKPNNLKFMKDAYCHTKSNPDEISSRVNANYEHAYRVTESKLELKKPENIKCITTPAKLNNARCSENYVGGPVPGGLHGQGARRDTREDSRSNTAEGIYIPGNSAQRRYIRMGVATPDLSTGSQTQDNTSDENQRLNQTERSRQGSRSNAAEGIYIPGNFAQRRYIRMRVATPDLSSGSQTQDNTSDENRRLNQSESSVVAENEQNSSSDHQSSEIETSTDNQNEVSGETSEREVVYANNLPLLHTNRILPYPTNEFFPERIENKGNTAIKQIQPADLQLTLVKPPRPLPRKSPVSSNCSLESEHNKRTAVQQEASNTASFQIQPSQSFNMSVPKEHLPPVPPPRPHVRDSEDILSLVPVPGHSHLSQRAESSVTHQFLFSQQAARTRFGMMTRSNFDLMPRVRAPVWPHDSAPACPHNSIRNRPPIPAQRTRFSNQTSEENSPPPLPPPRRKQDPL